MEHQVMIACTLKALPALLILGLGLGNPTSNTPQSPDAYYVELSNPDTDILEICEPGPGTSGELPTLQCVDVRVEQELLDFLGLYDVPFVAAEAQRTDRGLTLTAPSFQITLPVELLDADTIDDTQETCSGGSCSCTGKCDACCTEGYHPECQCGSSGACKCKQNETKSGADPDLDWSVWPPSV